ncbi:hypothetical protein GCM10022409_02780 [Hymenobacter glaciei]|uniref:Carboxypeptidase-like regulatory domain-containing protein n=1 Tax=Hymenobacter glaciei TaxID=877209 RepID=A0ABP7T841_9BACT
MLALLALSPARQAAAQATKQAPGIQGQVLDAKTRQPVPYASLSLLNEHNWTLANATGHFELAGVKKSGNDMLLIEGPGYLPRSVVLHNRALTDTTLTLDKAAKAPKVQPANSAQVVIRRLGSLAKKPGEGMIQGLMGSQFALFMEPSPKHQVGSVRNVSFFIGDTGFPKESFRVRIYRADGPNHSPGTNLLAENLIVAAPGGGQWFTVDIAPYAVEVPREGFYVGMEWIVAHEPTAFQDNYTPFGQVLRPTFEFKESMTWTFAVGNGWHLLPLRNAASRAYNAMIRAEIEELQ